MRIDRAARALWLLGLVGLLPAFTGAPAFLRVFLLFLVAPLVVDAARWIRRRRAQREEPPGEAAGVHPDLPLPEPARRYGASGLVLRAEFSTALGCLNPLQLAQVVRQVRGEGAARQRVVSDPAAYRQETEYTLPFEGEWLVMNGGVTPETSHSWELAGQRFAYDFVVADAEGRRHSGAGTRAEHYHAYGRPVLAPADGTVVAVRDGVRDAPRPGTGWVDWLAADFRGNWVAIRHAGREHSFLAHLVPGSVRVRPGDPVRRGEVVGLCGNSGHSTEPHLHFQVQDGPDFFRAGGLPVAFSGCVVDGAPADGPVHLRAGMRVRSAPGA
ncbi:MAG TPA: M23 family metallopeptidase [Longimicrobiaceae bacterium]|nr:M23 family metallopeptidase [Longimicrobiaceae bacterium]